MRAPPATKARSGASPTRHGAAATARVRGQLIGCFGHVNESKRIPQLYAAFAQVRERLPEARLLLVGGASARLADLETPDGVARPKATSTRSDSGRSWSPAT